MKVTVVPAQITTVEDRIAGNLNLTQILLLVAPIFISMAVYVLLPTFVRLDTYKVVIIVMTALFCGLSSIKIRDHILIIWLITVCRYNLRPKYYLFIKNDSYERCDAEALKESPAKTHNETFSAQRRLIPSISVTDAIKVFAKLDSSTSKLLIKSNKKGGLNVLITEIKEGNELTTTS